MAATLLKCGSIAVNSLSAAKGSCLGSENSHRNCNHSQLSLREKSTLQRERLNFTFKGQGLQCRPTSAAASNNAAFAPATMSMADFAEQEATKFRDEFLKVLESEGAKVESGEKVVAVCSEVIRKYAASYSGTLEMEPFAEMKSQLEKEGLATDKPLLAAIGWVRTNLYNDWKRWSK